MWARVCEGKLCHPLSVLLTFADYKTELHSSHLRYHVLVMFETSNHLMLLRLPAKIHIGDLIMLLCVFFEAAAVLSVQKDADPCGGTHPPAAG